VLTCSECLISVEAFHLWLFRRVSESCCGSQNVGNPYAVSRFVRAKCFFLDQYTKFDLFSR